MRTWLRTLLGTLLAGVAVLLVAWAPGLRASAQAAPDAPSDVSLAAFTAADLPPAPEGYVTRTDGDVRWDLPAEARAGEIVDQLAEIVRLEWPRIERELGAEI